jgi:hypothetical protein
MSYGYYKVNENMYTRKQDIKNLLQMTFLTILNLASQGNLSTQMELKGNIFFFLIKPIKLSTKQEN